ncbi:FecR domain-containing protein [Pseudomonas sp. PSKL.D1]|uniref:FecR domain-containing protein n=1 Tax=Pseudomonas sp. PSKL.D1 TaxID=3029060 RepID=UPI0023814A6C|nr:FecR domain-containing protein [Pseudomonas sp. PSKL.D1]WDY59180.1 FecR domain-containing protein [Pseudomonas sp. PSKL.D1]
MSAQPVSRTVAQQAARWVLQLQQDASEQQRLACAAWRAADAEHERAWQLATRFSAQVQMIPSDLARVTLQRSRRTALKALTSLVVLGSLGVSLSRTGALNNLMADASTAVGEQRRLTLDDGTELHLNTDTAVDIRYSTTERLLVLRKGEVYVSTGKDPRPLLLRSGRAVFMPLGTRFVVRQYEGHDVLSVLEGAVAVTPNQAATLRIEAGQWAWVSEREVGLFEAAAVRADWVDGVLRVDRMPLAQFVGELARYRQGWTRCAPEVAGIRVSGTFQLNDTDAALAALAMAFPVQLRYVTRYWVTVVAGGG